MVIIIKNMRLSLFAKIDKIFITEMHRWGIPALRVTLGVIFFWFGALKVIGVSPVAELVFTIYPFFPPTVFITFLGIWEMVIGACFIGNIFLRGTLSLLWLQLAGTFFALLLAPGIFFTDHNVFLLTFEGEFVIKNLVLMAAGLAIGGWELRASIHHNER